MFNTLASGFPDRFAKILPNDRGVGGPERTPLPVAGSGYSLVLD
jgi:hypothetical protein